MTEFKSGFVSIIGRPNVGKSTLLNAIIGQKVSIVSDKPSTTRNQVRGILTEKRGQIVFVDTPGIHKPRSLLGQRLNDSANHAISEVDLVLAMVDASQDIGRGDSFVLERAPAASIVVVNKTDLVAGSEILACLTKLAKFDKSSYYPISAQTGDGVKELLDELFGRLPHGPMYYPPETLTDISDADWVAELVREQLLIVAREELPHSIACKVTEWEWPRIRCEIHVERSSQKAIVIGKGGLVLKEVGTQVRRQLPEGAFLELFVKVNPRWQSKAHSLERLGL
ncbi:MAG: GTPase Era [Acidimicrobiaceae bacterium]|nr:GTPase Era [Acidimicrobiaceae bacterium]